MPQLALQPLAGEPVALPEGEVGVLERQLRQRRRTALHGRRVEDGQLAQQHAHGPAVRRNVMHRQEDEVVLAVQLQERRAQQPAGGQVARPPGLFFSEAESSRPADLRGQPGEIDRRQPPRLPGQGYLRGPAALFQEAGAERLVATDDLVEGRGEGGHGERPGEARRQRHVVERPGLQSVQEPEPLLGERKGGRPGPRPRFQRRCSVARRALAESRLDPARLLRQDRRRDQIGERHLHAESPADARCELGGEQGMTTQGEEVIVRANPFQPQHLAPQRSQQLFLGGAEHRLGNGAWLLGLRQDPVVDLAVRGEGQAGERHPGGRHHVVRQPSDKRRAEAGEEPLPGFHRLGRHNVGHQPPVASQQGCRNGRIADAGVLAQRALDLPRLDAVAADLDLPVGAAEELEDAVRQPPRQIARPVEAAERMRGKEVRRQVRPAVISTGHAGTSHVQLARDADRHRVPPAVQQVQLDAGERPAEEAPLARISRHPGRAGDCRLGRTVEDDDLGGREDLPQVAQQVGGHPLAAGEDGAQVQGVAGLPEVIGQPPHQARNSVHPGGAAQARRQPIEIEDLGAGQHLHLSAGQQGHEQLEQGDVEREGRQVQ